MKSTLAFALCLSLLTGFAKDTSQPDTKGLAPSTNFFAIVELPAKGDQKAAFDKTIAEFKKAAAVNPKGKAVIRTIDDIIGRLNDAGLCDISQGDLHSITAGVTLPMTVKEVAELDEADADFSIILRGKFDPKRTKAFCDTEGVKASLIDGQTAWDLDSLVSKLNPQAKVTKSQPGKEDWLAYADDTTLVIGNRSSLRKSLSAYKGQGPSLRPARIKAAEAITDWSVYCCFANPGLINDATRQEAATNPGVAKLVAAFPHDQIILIAGLKSDNASTSLIFANQKTQESIQYTTTASQSLLPKLIDAYLELFGQATNAGR